MATKRMVDCNFVNASGFMKLSNKAKLLYFYMISNADDRGFVDNANDIISKLTFNDDKSGNISLELLNNDYISATLELVNNGLLYSFIDNHGNAIYLIRHWWFHNRLISGLRTNYTTLNKKVEIIDYEYYLVKSTPKERNKENIDKNKVDKNRLNNTSDNEWENLMKECEDIDKENNNVSTD